MMTRYRNFAYAAILMISTSACNNASNGITAEDSKMGKAEKRETSIQSIGKDAAQNSNISDEKLKAVTAAYLNIKNALVLSNAEMASTEAAKMQFLVGEEEDKRMKKIIEDSEEIANSKDIEEQRKVFEDLSENMYKLLKTQGARDSEMYWQFCPMAKDNKGAYWLSAEKEIRNPYFGDRMLKCGSVRETLK